MLRSIDNRDSPVLLLGASVRAAAHSAVRAGLRPIAADLFGDVDLQQLARTLPVANSPQDFPQLARNVAPCPWMYTGALENHPEIIAALSAGSPAIPKSRAAASDVAPQHGGFSSSRGASQRPLWGNPAEVVERVRNPFLVLEALRANDLPAPEVRSGDSPPVPDGGWLLKPIRSAGGRGIAVWNRAAARHKTLSEKHYFQRRAPGRPLSAVFLATREQTHLVGVTRQLVGTRTLHAAPFAYCGSLGPVSLPPACCHETARTGSVLGREFQLRGLFGVDFLFDGRTVRPVEVNPRYTASVEVIEHALGLRLLDWHRRACELFGDPAASTELDAEVAATLAMRDIGEPDASASGFPGEPDASASGFPGEPGASASGFSRHPNAPASSYIPAGLRLRLACASTSGCPLRFVGKAVLYAPCDLVVPELNGLCDDESRLVKTGSTPAGRDPQGKKTAEILQDSDDAFAEFHQPGCFSPRLFPLPPIADIPQAGSTIQAGRPICTVLAATEMPLGGWGRSAAEPPGRGAGGSHPARPQPPRSAGQARACLRRLAARIRAVRALISTKFYS